MAKKLVVVMLVAMVAMSGRQTVMAEEVTQAEAEEIETDEKLYNSLLCDDQIPMLIGKFEEDNWHFKITPAEIETSPQNLSLLGLNEGLDLHEKLVAMADSNKWELGLCFNDQWLDVGIHKTNSLIHQGDVVIDTKYANHVLWIDKIRYRVAKGDTLSEIALKYNTTVQEIVDLNDVIVDSNLIYYDTYLELPITATTKGIE